MIIIDADKFVTYLIYSKHIDGLTCGEVKEAIEMCKVDVLDKLSALDRIRAEIEQLHHHPKLDFINTDRVVDMALEIIDKYKAESEGNNADSD